MLTVKQVAVNLQVSASLVLPVEAGSNNMSVEIVKTLERLWKPCRTR